MNAFGRPFCAAVIALTLGCAVSGCGNSARQSAAVHSPKNVCRQARRAAARLSGSTKLSIADSDPTNIECVLQTSSARFDVVAQASPQAWTQFDTAVVHQAQAFGGTSAPPKADLPQDLAGLGFNAAWIPAQDEFVATNGTQSSAGSFLTVTVTRRAGGGPSMLGVAKAVATATLAVAPKGASPGPPPA
jgi:hypothetical protein